MKKLALAAMAACLALPVLAQEAPPRKATHDAAATQAKPASPRERARLAKAQNKEGRCAPTKPKKAAAT